MRDPRPQVALAFRTQHGALGRYRPDLDSTLTNARSHSYSAGPCHRAGDRQAIPGAPGRRDEERAPPLLPGPVTVAFSLIRGGLAIWCGFAVVVVRSESRIFTNPGPLQCRFLSWLRSTTTSMITCCCPRHPVHNPRKPAPCIAPLSLVVQQQYGPAPPPCTRLAWRPNFGRRIGAGGRPPRPHLHLRPTPARCSLQIRLAHTAFGWSRGYRASSTEEAITASGPAESQVT